MKSLCRSLFNLTYKSFFHFSAVFNFALYSAISKFDQEIMILQERCLEFLFTFRDEIEQKELQFLRKRM